MKAIKFEKFGGPEVLKVVNIDLKKPDINPAPHPTSNNSQFFPGLQ